LANRKLVKIDPNLLLVRANWIDLRILFRQSGVNSELKMFLIRAR